MTDEPVAPAAAPDEECWTKIEGAQSEAPGGKATAYRPRIHDAVRALANACHYRMGERSRQKSCMR